MAAAFEISVDAAVTAVLSELDELHTLKEEQNRKTALEGPFLLLLAGFDCSSLKRHIT